MSTALDGRGWQPVLGERTGRKTTDAPHNEESHPQAAVSTALGDCRAPQPELRQRKMVSFIEHRPNATRRNAHSIPNAATVTGTSPQT